MLCALGSKRERTHGGGTLAKKLGIKPGFRLLLANALGGYAEQLGTLPEGVELSTAAQEKFDLVRVFVYNRADIDRHTGATLQAPRMGGFLWFTYPKKRSSIGIDITLDVGWESMHALELRPVAQISIDATWTGFRFRPASDVRPIRRPNDSAERGPSL
jgi:hypothetical protein